MMPRLTAVVTARVTLEAVDMLLLTVLGLQCHQFGHPACFITRAAASSDNSMDTLATGHTQLCSPGPLRCTEYGHTATALLNFSLSTRRSVFADLSQ